MYTNLGGAQLLHAMRDWAVPGRQRFYDVSEGRITLGGVDLRYPSGQPIYLE